MNNPEHNDIVLSSLLKDKYIECALSAKNKEEAVAGLVGLIGKCGKIKNKKAFLKALIDREKLGSTAIGNGVAIPHAKVDGFPGMLLAFARVPGGINFNSLDGEKTYLFFALVSSAKDVGLHLKGLAKISHLIKDKFIVELLKKAETKKEVIKIIKSSEKPAR